MRASVVVVPKKDAAPLPRGRAARAQRGRPRQRISLPEARNRLIVAHLDRPEGELARTRAAVHDLRALLEPPVTPRAVEHRTVPLTAAIAIQATVDREELLAWWPGALGELHAVLGAQALHPAEPPGGVYAGRGDATVFIPAGGAARAAGRVERFPRHRRPRPMGDRDRMADIPILSAGEDRELMRWGRADWLRHGRPGLGLGLGMPTQRVCLRGVSIHDPRPGIGGLPLS
jgi:hypothetical protein